MIRALALVWLLLSIQLGRAESALTGFWLTQSQDGVVAVSACDGALCARIVGIFLDRPDDPIPADYRGVSQCNLLLIGDARQIRPNLWKGHITDPRNGKLYGVELHLDPDGNLAVRGFLGVPLLGQTQTWTRYDAEPPADCRIEPASPLNGQLRPSQRGSAQ